MLMGSSNGVWPLNNFEDFSAAFWAPLKVGYVPSYYFNQSGFYFGAVLKLVHALTDWALGSKAVTYKHFQFFGYLARATFAVATLGVVAIYWRRRRDMISVVTAAAMLLAFRLAAPFVVQIYDLRVGLQLSYVLVMLLIALATLEAMGRFLDGEAPTRNSFFYWGALSGATLFEAPHYLPFFLPLFAVVMARPGSAGEFGARIGRWAAGASVGAAAGLLGLYGLDYRSAVAAALSNFKGIVIGFPQPQPGFDQFTSLIFDPRSDYFLIKVAIAIQLAVIVVFAAAFIVAWRRQDNRMRYGALVIGASFAAVWLVHLRIWRTHGSYTTVFSVVYFGFLTVALILQNRWRAREIGDRSIATGCAIAAAAAGFLVPCGTTLWRFPYSETYYNDKAYGESFRSFNAFLDRLPRPFGLAFNQDISYFPLIAHCNFSQIMYHMGSTAGYADVRFSERIQADRYPDYRLMYYFRISSVAYNWRAAHLDAEVAQGFQPLNVPTELVPLAQAVGSKYHAALEGEMHSISVDDIPPGQNLARFLASHPDSRLEKEDFGSIHWSFMPLRDPDMRDAIMKGAWPASWSRQGRAYYLVTTPLGFYLLGLASGEFGP